MILLRLIGFIIGGYALFIQFWNLLFVTLNRSRLDKIDYSIEDNGQLLTVIVCLWFTVSQLINLLRLLDPPNRPNI